jgi:hypothetical protein
MPPPRDPCWKSNQLAAYYDALIPPYNALDYIKLARKREIEHFGRKVDAGRGYFDDLRPREYTERIGLPAASPSTHARLCNDANHDRIFADTNAMIANLEENMRYLEASRDIKNTTSADRSQDIRCMRTDKNAEIDRRKKVTRYMDAHPRRNIATSQPSFHKADDDDADSNSEGYDGGSEDSEDQQEKITELIEIYGKLGKSKKALHECIERGQSLRKRDWLWQSYVESLEEVIEKLKELAFDFGGNDYLVNAAIKEAMEGFTSPR